MTPRFLPVLALLAALCLCWPAAAVLLKCDNRYLTSPETTLDGAVWRRTFEAKRLIWYARYELLAARNGLTNGPSRLREAREYLAKLKPEVKQLLNASFSATLKEASEITLWTDHNRLSVVEKDIGIAETYFGRIKDAVERDYCDANQAAWIAEREMKKAEAIRIKTSEIYAKAEYLFKSMWAAKRVVREAKEKAEAEAKAEAAARARVAAEAVAAARAEAGTRTFAEAKGAARERTRMDR